MHVRIRRRVGSEVESGSSIEGAELEDFMRCSRAHHSRDRHELPLADIAVDGVDRANVEQRCGWDELRSWYRRKLRRLLRIVVVSEVAAQLDDRRAILPLPPAGSEQIR